MNPGVERYGMGTFVGCGRDRGWTKDEVRSEREERGDTEARENISISDGHKPG